MGIVLMIIWRHIEQHAALFESERLFAYGLVKSVRERRRLDDDTYSYRCIFRYGT